MRSKTGSLMMLAVCTVAALGVWLSASAVISSLDAEFSFAGWHKAAFTSAVQIGFVAGTLTSAILGLADRWPPQRFFAGAALIAAIANYSLLWIDITSATAIALRFLTGACMAGIYPVGMKIATTWANRDMGLLVGILTAAVTLGSASPILANAFGGADWRFAIKITSILAVLAAGLVFLVTLGPNSRPSAPFDPKAALLGFRDKALRLANFGYLGHMWELYAVWAWLGIFLETSFRLNPGGETDNWARMATFAVIGIGGGVGCIAGGLIADRMGRTRLTAAALVVSGCCTVGIGFLHGGPALLLFAVAMIWGIAIVADSAQFSASTAELAPPDRVGTLLTVQTCAGFLLTLITLQAMPYAVDWLGWRYAFACLCLGPVFGVISMMALRRHPDAKKLANGKR